MKILLLLPLTLLTACSVLLPIPHDPAMFNQIVSVKISVDKLNCEQKDLNNWNDASNKIHHLAVYTDLRKDPQAQAIVQLQEALGKARDSKNKLFCENILKINKARIDVVVDAWRGR